MADGLDRPSVCLGNINPGQLSVGFVTSMLSSFAQNQFANYIFHPNGPYLDMGRNVVVKHFLKTDCDYLLFIDSDIQWTVEDIDQLYSNLNPECIIGGYYMNPYANGLNPVVYEFKDQDEHQIMESITEDELLAKADENGIANCTAIGTGFMAIPRNVLDKVLAEGWEAPCEYFAQPIYNGIHLGEDLAFCLRVRAVGFPVLIDTKVKLGHHKTIRL